MLAKAMQGLFSKEACSPQAEAGQGVAAPCSGLRHLLHTFTYWQELPLLQPAAELWNRQMMRPSGVFLYFVLPLPFFPPLLL